LTKNKTKTKENKAKQYNTKQRGIPETTCVFFSTLFLALLLLYPETKDISFDFVLISFQDVFPDKATERKILSLVIRCQNDDCDWTGELRNKTVNLGQ